MNRNLWKMGVLAIAFLISSCGLANSNLPTRYPDRATFDSADCDRNQRLSFAEMRAFTASGRAMDHDPFTLDQLKRADLFVDGQLSHDEFLALFTLERIHGFIFVSQCK